MRTPGSAKELEVRRQIAGRLLLRGMGVSEVAGLVEASTSAVSRWKQIVKRDGLEGLEPKAHPGRRPKLSATQRQQLIELLEKGPLAAGYPTDAWTCSRVAQVIERRFGVRYHVDHVWRLLDNLGWSCQMPEQRARERDEQAIARWREDDWPRIKKGRKQQASIVFLDESGFMLQPVRRRTWAPRGATPIQRAWDRHDRLSAIAAISVSPVRQRLRLFDQIHYCNVRWPQVAPFLLELHGRLRRKIILVWDRSSVHRATASRLRESHPQWFEVEWLPAYAPELDPVEECWNHTKCFDLANFVPDNIDQLAQAVAHSLNQQRNDQQLLRSYFEYAELQL